ncbi:MAG: deoxyribose-phosphate aldolase [Bacteroidia bacterium]|nr:deoxyribose-phosphate aldolase [Bacteroidia bacterium]MDW8133596.1 deoxyribose-phosphate aldolase [Bacteroidia bacterium]
MGNDALASYIDYTLLRPGTRREEIQELCRIALAKGYKSVCVPPYYVAEASQRLEGSAVQVATVIGFPHGMHLTEVKEKEASLALQMGAKELDIVANLAAFLSGDISYVRAEIRHLAEQAHAQGALIKIILETALLTPEQALELAQYCAAEGADFVKTSTGFATKGAELEIVRLLRESLPSEIKIKASGGIRTAEQAWAFIEAGAARIGTSTAL